MLLIICMSAAMNENVRMQKRQEYNRSECSWYRICVVVPDIIDQDVRGSDVCKWSVFYGYAC